jgi:phosphoribosylanthranilate isomerase
MKKTIIQIYEVQKPQEAEALADLGVDHIGSVLISEERWKQPVIKKTVQTVQNSGAKSGVIPLSKDPIKIFSALDYYQPDFVHLCDALSPFPGAKATVVRDFDALLSLQIDVKDRFPQIDIMRSLCVPQAGMRKADEIQNNILHFVELFAPVSDYFLIDTLLDGDRQPVSGYVGITGRVCDWKMAKAVIEQSPIPVILAGGLSGENVYEAVIHLKPAGVDSCTQTNARDQNGQSVRFKKDMKKVRRFVEEVRRADLFIQENESALT